MTDISDRPLGHVIDNWIPPPLPGPPSLIGRWSRVEPLNAARHGQALYNALAGHDWVFDYLSERPFSDPGSYGAFLSDAAARPDFRFVALCDASGTAFGLASYMRMSPDVGVIEVGNICIAPSGQKSTKATEALFLMMKWAFDVGYRRYEWKCNALNVPSRRAAQRLGFSYDGLFRKATIVKGRSRDTAWFSIINDEWPDLCKAFTHWLDPTNFTADGSQIERLSALTSPFLVVCDPIVSGNDHYPEKIHFQNKPKADR